MSFNPNAEIEQDCARVLAAYTQAIDHGDSAGAADLFTSDGLFIAGKRRLQGREELMKITEGRPEGLVSRHLIGTILVTAEAEDVARAVTYYVVFRGQRGPEGGDRPLPMELPFSMGEWHSRLRRTRDGWRIAQQEVMRLFQERPPAAPSPTAPKS